MPTQCVDVARTEDVILEHHYGLGLSALTLRMAVIQSPFSRFPCFDIMKQHI